MIVCPVPKISLVVMKWRRASHHGRFTLWHNGNLRSGDFFFLAGEKKIAWSQVSTMAAELHNSVDVLCRTAAAEYTTRWIYFVAQQTPSYTTL